MSKRNLGKLKVKGRKYSFGCQLIDFEKKCFDWRAAGRSVDDVDDGYEARQTSSGSVKVEHKHHIVKTAYYRRPYDYKKNFLFSLTEMLSNIVSFIRVWLLSFLILAVIVAAVVLIVTSGQSLVVLWAILGVYGGIIALSLLLALLGLLWRKVFKLSEKTDEAQVANGFVKWSEYTDDNSVEYDSY